MFWILVVTYSFTSNCSLYSTLARLLDIFTSPNMSIGIGDRVQTTITETVSDLCTVDLIIWS